MAPVSSSAAAIATSSAPMISSVVANLPSSSVATSAPTSSRMSSSSRLPQASAQPLLSKRGLVYVPSRNTAIQAVDDPIWVQPGSPLSWYYNYDYRATAKYDAFPQMQYVPQLWGDFSNTFINTVVGYMQAGRNITHIIAFNEPDGPGSEGGSNITPARAAARWIQDIEPLKAYGIKLGAPAVTGSPRGFTWLEQWFTACNGGCNPDFMTAHYYGDFVSIASFIGQMSGTYALPIWVTEFADAHNALRATQSNDNTTVGYFDGLARIERYSYFGAFRSDVSNVGVNATFLDQCGRLTDLGAWYLNMPSQAKGVVPQSSACPASLSPSAASSTRLVASSSSPAAIVSSSAATPALPSSSVR